MRRYLLLSLCLTAFTFFAGHVSLKASGCEASCIFGLCYCSVTCDPGETPVCKSGVFSSSCTCVKTSTFPKRGITQGEYDAAAALSDHLAAEGGSEGRRLASAMDNVITISRGEDEDAYSAAEDAFANAYEDVSQGTRDLIAAWLEDNGYGR